MLRMGSGNRLKKGKKTGLKVDESGSRPPMDLERNGLGWNQNLATEEFDSAWCDRSGENNFAGFINGKSGVKEFKGAKAA